MKIRSVENSLRMRVRKSDLVRLQRDGRISVNLTFPGQACLSFSLEIAPVPTFQAQLTPAKVQIVIPQDQAENWINSQLVALRWQWPLEDGNMLSLLIEKDFPCRHVAAEAFEDTFYELVPEED